MHKRRKFSQTERDYLLQRANGCCEYCLTHFDFTPETFEIEHIIPLVVGGSNEFGNLAFSCRGYNSRKGQKTNATDSSTGEVIKIFNPRIDNWNHHFFWKDNFTVIESNSTKGRVTIDLLKLNRSGLVNLRRALVSIRIHPPKSEK